MAHPSPTRGFTIIEILIVIAVMALMTAVVVVNVAPFLAKPAQPPLPELLRLAVREARFQAAKTKGPTFLAWDHATSRFLVSGENGGTLTAFDTDYEPDSPELSVTLNAILPRMGTSVQSLGKPETREVDRVRFAPDRSSTPFLVIIKDGLEESTHRFDPFSDAELEEKKTGY